MALFSHRYVYCDPPFLVLAFDQNNADSWRRRGLLFSS